MAGWGRTISILLLDSIRRSLRHSLLGSTCGLVTCRLKNFNPGPAGDRLARWWGEYDVQSPLIAKLHIGFGQETGRNSVVICRQIVFAGCSFVYLSISYTFLCRSPHFSLVDTSSPLRSGQDDDSRNSSKRHRQHGTMSALFSLASIRLRTTCPNEDPGSGCRGRSRRRRTVLGWTEEIGCDHFNVRRCHPQ